MTDTGPYYSTPLTEEERSELLRTFGMAMSSYIGVPEERRHLLDILGFIMGRRAEVERGIQVNAWLTKLQCDLAALQKQKEQPTLN